MEFSYKSCVQSETKFPFKIFLHVVVSNHKIVHFFDVVYNMGNLLVLILVNFDWLIG